MDWETLTCRDLIESIDAFLDGSVSESQRRVFDAHLVQCLDCVRYVESYRATVRLQVVGFPPELDAADPAPEHLVEAILASRRSTE